MQNHSHTQSQNHLQKRVSEWCEQHHERIISCLQTLIQAASFSEKHVQDVLEAEWKRANWQTEWQSLRDIPWANAPELIRNKSDDDLAQLWNVIGIKKGAGGNAARSLLLNGHVDVVPCGEDQYWTDPPFAGIVREGSIYGRGSCDMLGGIVAMWMAMQRSHSFMIVSSARAKSLSLMVVMACSLVVVVAM